MQCVVWHRASLQSRVVEAGAIGVLDLGESEGASGWVESVPHLGVCINEQHVHTLGPEIAYG
eukprot:3608773-Lingulodinium_polyedra.AAC.1